MISHPLPSQEKLLDTLAARLGTTHVLTEANDIASYLVEDAGFTAARRSPSCARATRRRSPS